LTLVKLNSRKDENKCFLLYKKEKQKVNHLILFKNNLAKLNSAKPEFWKN